MDYKKFDLLMEKSNMLMDASFLADKMGFQNKDYRMHLAASTLRRVALAMQKEYLDMLGVALGL